MTCETAVDKCHRAVMVETKLHAVTSLQESVAQILPQTDLVHHHLETRK